MDGNKIFPEQISPFLNVKLQLLEQKFGKDSSRYLGLARQYQQDPMEIEIDYKTERRRHYDADLGRDSNGHILNGIERLYRRSVVLELSTACFARCRWCLRANYNPFTLNENDVMLAAKYFGSKENRDDIHEVLITGGDPCIAPDLLNKTLDCILKYAPNISIVRIGTRLPVQEPKRVFDEKLKNALRKRDGMRVEIGTQINHVVELFDESKEAYQFFQDMGMKIYNQQVLLKGVNNDIHTLMELYDTLRDLGIEAHYMFHCVPIRGMSHHRTTMEEGLELVKKLTASGYISGRAKPKYTAMTDIGKITLYEGTILEKRGDMLLLQSSYKMEERMKWNPMWNMPDSTEVDDDGYLRVWYKDAKMHNYGLGSTYVHYE